MITLENLKATQLEVGKFGTMIDLKCLLKVACHLIWYNIDSPCRQMNTNINDQELKPILRGLEITNITSFGSLCDGVVYQEVIGVHSGCHSLRIRRSRVYYVTSKTNDGCRSFSLLMWHSLHDIFRISNYETTTNTETSGMICTNSFPQLYAVQTMVNRTENIAGKDCPSEGDDQLEIVG